MKKMKKNIKKISVIALASIMSLLPMAYVYAEEDFSSLPSVHYFRRPEGGGMNLVDKSEEIKNNNYWVDLKYSKVENLPVVAGKTIEYFKTLVPKNVLEPKDTEVNKHAKVSTIVDFYCAPDFVSTGIIPDWSGLNIFLHPREPKDNYYFKQFSKIPEERTNPHKFKQSDILTDEETNNPLEKLQVLADIKAKDSADSKKIDEYKRGDSIELDFSMNASWFKRYMNGFALFSTQVGGMSDEGIKKIYNQYAMSDAQLVFTLDIPDGVIVNNPGARISGLDGFTADVSKEGNTLIVKLRKNERGQVYEWKKLIEKINSIDTSNISVSISGLSVSNTAAPESKVSIRGTASGFYDFATSHTREFYLPSPEHNNHEDLGPGHENCAERCYWSFAAIQDSKGLDAGAPQGKPNLISYTFKVNKTPNNSGGGGGGSTTPNPPGRVDGDDRTDTGIKISKKYYDKAKTVIVVRHDLFPDSMTASVLAKLKDAPILLNPTDKLDPRVGAEIKRLGAEEVIIVGGPDSISEKVREELKSYDKDKAVERIAGVDRYGTSEMVARRVVGITGKKNTGVIASGQVFPDALSVGTFASRDGYPILLVRKDLVPSQIERAIKDLDIKKIYIAGGTNTISKSIEAKLPRVEERMAGKDRYETSVAIARSKFKSSTEAFVASGEEFADALVISPVSGKYNRPTLLVSRDKKTNAVVKKYIEESYLNSITAIGGEEYLPNSILLDLVGR